MDFELERSLGFGSWTVFAGPVDAFSPSRVILIAASVLQAMLDAEVPSQFDKDIAAALAVVYLGDGDSSMLKSLLPTTEIKRSMISFLRGLADELRVEADAEALADVLSQTDSATVEPKVSE